MPASTALSRATAARAHATGAAGDVVAQLTRALRGGLDQQPAAVEIGRAHV